MARKTKIETEEQAGSTSPSPSAKPKRTKATPKKRVATTIKPAASKKNPRSAILAEPSDEEIRLRAYFIAERRLQLSLPGDSANDWIEARRQLIEEAAAR